MIPLEYKDSPSDNAVKYFVIIYQAMIPLEYKDSPSDKFVIIGCTSEGVID